MKLGKVLSGMRNKSFLGAQEQIQRHVESIKGTETGPRRAAQEPRVMNTLAAQKMLIQTFVFSQSLWGTMALTVMHS